MADAIDLIAARVLLNESRARRQSPHACQRRYAHTLLAAAACARLRYMADRIIERWSVVQPGLFDSSHQGKEQQ